MIYRFPKDVALASCRGLNSHVSDRLVSEGVHRLADVISREILAPEKLWGCAKRVAFQR
jgi:hypothetical protein